MMLSLLRLTLLATLLVALLVGALHLQPQSNHASAYFGDCAMPCWHGVQPGTTSHEAALAQLNQAIGSDPVVTSCVSPPANPCDLYRWTSPDRQRAYAGLFIERGQIAGVVAFSPGFTLGEALLMLDHLDGADPGTVADNEFYAQLFFDDARIAVRASSACPGTFFDLMNAPVSSVEVQSPDLDVQYDPLTTLAVVRQTFYRICGAALQ